MLDHAETILDNYGPLIKKIARSACFSSATIDILDLIQVGEIAALRAVKKYDPSAGATIRSYVARLVRQDIYREAARFLGVFTVDPRVTSLAAKANRMSLDGHSDESIATALDESSSYALDADHVRDLRLAYSRRQYVVTQDDDALDESDADQHTIKELLIEIVQDEPDKIILDNRILGTSSVRDIARLLSVSPRRVYELENDLKDRIKHAIKGMTE
jgi:RNA polymerase sigma factor (sigma-70 family)